MEEEHAAQVRFARMAEVEQFLLRLKLKKAAACTVTRILHSTMVFSEDSGSLCFYVVDNKYIAVIADSKIQSISDRLHAKLRPMSTAVAPRTIMVSESLLRREAVDNAITDLRLEGLAPSAQVRHLLEQFVQGEINGEELLRAVLAQ